MAQEIENFAETAADLMLDLQRAMTLRPQYKRVYFRLNRVMQRVLDEKTRSCQMTLTGTFAKVDYLLKEHQAPQELVRKINDTRVRLRRCEEMDNDELELWCGQDVRNLAEFIALLFVCEIPGELQVLFPAEEKRAAKAHLLGECLRVIVRRWDEKQVWVTREDSGEDAVVCYAEGNRLYDFDWSYLHGMFCEGMQLNLIRPRANEGRLYPELIIVEPDYLVDISTVARCFTNYAESPLVNLVKKITPNQPTEATVLGNLASQLLDESIHQLPASHTYKDSAREFYRTNALSLLTAGVSDHFHRDAQMQKQYIDDAIHRTLPAGLGRFDSREGIVEPSFFSEMLGLQGRMDYLQLDYKVLLEQKSGKGEFPYGDFITPRAKLEHYVQLTLYMLLIRYNRREQYEANNRELHAFLLYSKYRDSLFGVSFAPEVIFRALKVRNGIAWLEMHLAQPHGFDLLKRLTPEMLNKKNIDNPLWNNYERPQLQLLLEPIHKASELERRYYLRFLTFVANEHMLSKLGNKTKENSGFASKWHDTLEEKLQAGNIYDKLTLISPTRDTEGKVESVELRFRENQDNDMSNFRVGDIVILYPYAPDTIPDVRATMVIRCTIEEIRLDTIRLRLRAAQSDNRVFVHEEGKLWAIEHDFMEASYSGLYRGLHAFLSAPQERRDLLMLQRHPKVDTSKALQGEYGQFNELALRVKQAQELFLIIGPPGTGKTSFGLLNTVKEELLDPHTNLLLMSYTNRAVDEICSKLYEEGIDFLRLGSELNCSEIYKDKLFNNCIGQCDRVSDLQQKLLDTRVIVGTTSALMSSQALFQLKQFSLAVIDEASQILEPHIISLLGAQYEGLPAIRKVVMIGDQKQLPAVVQQTPENSRVEDDMLNDIYLTDCRLSLFERLLRKYKDDPDVTYMLTRQGRMHPDIADFPNQRFYGGKLIEVPLPHQQATLTPCNEGDELTQLLCNQRIAFVPVVPEEPGTSDKVNQSEADVIARLVVKIFEREREQFSVEDTVGVIVPYRNQIATVRNTIDRYGYPELHNITIDTVERYQGSQRRYIIYGFTVQYPYQLRFLTDSTYVDEEQQVIDRKLNVAMTRAQEHLVMVGNPVLLSRNALFRDLISYIRERTNASSSDNQPV